MNDAPLRFCMVTTFYPPANFGGDGIYVQRLAEGLAQAGHRVDVVYSEAAHRACGGGILDDAPPESPVRRLPLRSSWPVATTLASHQAGTPIRHAHELRSILDSGDYDVIHFHNVSLLGGPGIFSYGGGLKLHTSHDYWLVCPTHALFAYDREPCVVRSCLSCTLSHARPPQLWRYTGAVRAAVAHLDGLLAPSGFAADVLRAEAFDAPVFQVGAPVLSADVVRRPPGPDAAVFVYAGRLERLKGILALLDLFEGYDRARLVIAGEGRLQEEVRRRAAALPHVDYVGYLGRAELDATIARATAVLAPSLCYETFGLTSAEAIAMGVPAVVRDGGALAELVRASGGGLTFENDAEWTAALETLRTEPATRDRIGARGVAYAAAHWSQSAHVRDYVRLVRSLRPPSARASDRETGTAA